MGLTLTNGELHANGVKRAEDHHGHMVHSGASVTAGTCTNGDPYPAGTVAFASFDSTGDLNVFLVTDGGGAHLQKWSWNATTSSFDVNSSREVLASDENDFTGEAVLKGTKVARIDFHDSRGTSVAFSCQPHLALSLLDTSTTPAYVESWITNGSGHFTGAKIRFVQVQQKLNISYRVKGKRV